MASALVPVVCPVTKMRCIYIICTTHKTLPLSSVFSSFILASFFSLWHKFTTCSPFHFLFFLISFSSHLSLFSSNLFLFPPWINISFQPALPDIWTHLLPLFLNLFLLVHSFCLFLIPLLFLCYFYSPPSLHPSIPDDHTNHILQLQHLEHVPIWRSLFNLCPTRDLSHGAAVSLIRTFFPSLQLLGSFPPRPLVSALPSLSFPLWLCKRARRCKKGKRMKWGSARKGESEKDMALRVQIINDT